MFAKLLHPQPLFLGDDGFLHIGYDLVIFLAVLDSLMDFVTEVCSSERNPAIKESNRIFDELFIRTSLQNREFSLIIIYVGGAGAS